MTARWVSAMGGGWNGCGRWGRRTLLAWALLVGAAPPLAAADLRVAFIGTLSGAAAARALDQESGLQLGIKDSGGRFGGIEFSYSRADDHRNLDEAVRLFQSLTRQGRLHVLVLSSAIPGAAEVLAPLAAASGTVILNLGDATPAAAGRDCNANLFSLVGLPETMFLVDGQYLQSLGVRVLAVAAPDSDAGRAALATVERTFHGKVEAFLSRPGRMAFAAELARIRGVHPDIIYLLHTGGMAVEFLSQYASSGLKGQVAIVAPYTTFDEFILAASAPATLDATSVGPWSEDLENPANHRMTGEFELEFGRPPSSQAAIGYDTALLLDTALRGLDKKLGDTEQVRAALRHAELAGTRGIVKFDSNQFPIQTYFVRQVVSDARERLVNNQKGVFAHDVRDGHAADCPMRAAVETPSKKVRE